MGKDADGNSKSYTYDYYGSIAGVICSGLIDQVSGIVSDGKLVWPPYDTTDPNKGLWTSGYAYSVGNFVLLSGRVWRCINAHTASAANKPPNITNWWMYGVSLEPAQGDWTSGTGYIVGDDVELAGDWTCTGNHTANAGNAPPDLTYWAVKEPVGIAVAGYGNINIYRGAQNQTLSALYAAEIAMTSAGHPNYRGFAFAVLRRFLFGRERTTPPNIEIICRRRPRQSIVTDPYHYYDYDSQINPLAALAEVFTDTRFGLGQAAATLDATTWQATAEQLGTGTNYAKTYISPLLDTAQPMRVIVGDTLRYFDGWMRHNSAGVIEAGRILHGESAGDLSAKTLTEDDLVEEPAWGGGGWADTVNEVLVRYRDYFRAWKDTAAKGVNLCNLNVVGEPRSKTVDLPWISRAQQATDMAVEWAKVYGEPSLEGTLTVRAERASTILAGDLFALTHSALGVTVICRCVQKTLAAPPAGRVRLKFEAERGLGAIPYQPGTTPVEPEAVAAPEVLAADQVRVWQPPPQLAGDGSDVAVLAHRTDPLSVNIGVYLKEADATNYQQLGTQYRWAVKGVLSQDYDFWKAYQPTASRARASNVATIVTASPHCLTTGQVVDVSGLGGTGYNATGVTVTVTSTTAFTYSNTGGNEGTTADTAGQVTKTTMEDLTENLQMASAAGIPSDDWERIVGIQTEDQINDNNLLCILIYDATEDRGSLAAADATDDWGDLTAATHFEDWGADYAPFEICTVRESRLDGGVYKLKVRRARYGTTASDFVDGDEAWLIERAAIVNYSHESFADYVQDGTTVNFKLPVGTAWATTPVADLSPL